MTLCIRIMLNVNTWQNPSFDTDSLSQTFSILISRDQFSAENFAKSRRLVHKIPQLAVENCPNSVADDLPSQGWLLFSY